MGNILNGPLFYDEKTMNMFVCGVFYFFSGKFDLKFLIKDFTG